MRAPGGTDRAIGNGIPLVSIMPGSQSSGRAPTSSPPSCFDLRGEVRVNRGAGGLCPTGAFQKPPESAGCYGRCVSNSGREAERPLRPAGVADVLVQLAGGFEGGGAAGAGAPGG